MSLSGAPKKNSRADSFMNEGSQLLFPLLGNEILPYQSLAFHAPSTIASAITIRTPPALCFLTKRGSLLRPMK